jgi:SAM-dependent methyltransferase
MRSVLCLLLLLAACDVAPAAQSVAAVQSSAADDPGRKAARQVPGPSFPPPDRPVADIVSAAWSDEASRDNSGEAAEVFRLAGVRPGMAVADIGAGSGYYTVRLSPAVGASGKVYANDIIPDYLARLRRRVEGQGLSNVAFVLGDAGNANLAPASVDLALMVHMYHEISDPFGLLWHLHQDLKPGGKVAIVDADRPTARHGTPPDLLRCELEAAGFRQVSRHRLEGGSYLALFEPFAQPRPEAIRPCRAG